MLILEKGLEEINEFITLGARGFFFLVETSGIQGTSLSVCKEKLLLISFELMS